jgi:HSP20 family protein
MMGSLFNSGGNLLDEFQRLQRDMDSLFYPTRGRANIRAAARGSFPAINIGTTSDAVHIYAYAPGVDRESLDVMLEQNLLTLSGERKAEGVAENDRRSGFHRRERFAGKFRRVIALPEDVDPDRVEAVYRDGVLHITVHKREAAKPRQIDVSSG